MKWGEGEFVPPDLVLVPGPPFAGPTQDSAVSGVHGDNRRTARASY